MRERHEQRAHGAEQRRRSTHDLIDAPGSPWHTVSAREPYRNAWLHVTEYSVVRPDGAPGIYGVVDPGDNVTIVALDAGNRVWLVEEFVYPLQRTLWNVPTGAVEQGEDPVAAARRELEEEAGLQAREWTGLGSYYLSPGISTQQTHLFLARGLRQVRARPEGTERIATHQLPLAEVYAACLDGAIAAAPCVLAIWRTWALVQQGGAT